MEWGRRTSLTIENLLEAQNGATQNFGLSPQIQPKFGLAKIAKLTAKIIHVNYEMQHNEVMHRAPHAYVQIKTGRIMLDSSGAAKEN